MEKNKKKNWLLPAARAVALVLLSAFVGLALMTAVYILPTGPIKANVEKSVEIFRVESNYPKLIQYHFNTTLDNWTDATILAEAAYDGERGLMDRVALVPHLEVEGEHRAESLVKLYGGEENLEIADEDYGRYWHGYLLFIKPLLLIMDYGMLREFMALMQLVLFVLILKELFRRKREDLSLALLLVYAFINPMAVSQNINYAVMCFVLFAQLLFILRHEGIYSRRENWLYHFVFIGCVTAFFDYLTWPLAGFGIPMLLLLSLYPDTTGRDFLATVKTGIGWLFGYVAMWASKWIFGSLISGVNIIKDAGETFAMRSGGNVGEEFSRLELAFHAVYKNLSASKLALAVTELILIGSFVYACVKRKKPCLGRALLLCAFMAAPLAWYALAANHSYIHYFFTYRTLSISVFGAVLMGLELVNGRNGAADA